MMSMIRFAALAAGVLTLCASLPVPSAGALSAGPATGAAYVTPAPGITSPAPHDAPGRPGTPGATGPSAPRQPQGGYVPVQPGQATGKLRVKVIDGRTKQPLAGAEVVLLETEKRYRTGADGLTPWIDAPVLRSARFRFLVNELHGQLTLISYKNGYRDSIHMGVRMNEGTATRVTIWQYKIVPGPDTRVEPVVFQEPYHRLWLIQLADRFRRPSQLGEGYEHP